MMEATEKRSEELNDFLPYAPRAITRSGNVVILLIVIIAIGFAQVIRYPETVTGAVTITTSTPTIKLVNKIGGRLERLLVKNDAPVRKGMVIAEIENPTTSQDIATLKEFLGGVRIEGRKVLFAQPTEWATIKLGDAGSDYTYMLSELEGYTELMNSSYYPEKIKAIDTQINAYKSLNAINLNSKSLFEKELGNISSKAEMNRKLYNEKVIALADLNESQNELLAKQQGLNAIKKSIVEGAITMGNLERQKLELQNEFSERRDAYVKDISRLKRNLENYINTWKKNYTIIAPIAGRIEFSQNIVENQHVNAGENLFVIVPHSATYMGVITTPPWSIGKIKTGQTVLVSLDGYPVHDFGKVTGSISKMLSIPSKNSYTLYVAFGPELKTAYQKKIEFKPEMSGKAEVVVFEASFLERILKNVRAIAYN
jgi:multidrug resistance efflux pump